LMEIKFVPFQKWTDETNLIHRNIKTTLHY